MIPSLFVSLPELPRTANGKVDRQNLPAPEVARSSLGVEYEPPSGDVEEAVAAMWKEVLHLEQVGRHDRFFELGGHSLMAMQILTRITRQFGVELPLKAVFENLTVAALSELIVTTELAAADEALLAELMAGMDDNEAAAPEASELLGEIAELVRDGSQKGESDG
jgi:acyl carrier protein